MAGARRGRLAGVGGTVRRAGVRPAGRGGHGRRPETGGPAPRSGRSSHRGRAARPRGEPHRPRRRSAGRGGRRQPRSSSFRPHRQRRHRTARHPAGRRAGPGRAGRDRAASGAGRRRHRARAAHHPCPGGSPAAAAGRRADRDGQHRAGLCHLPILARVPGPRAAPPTGPGSGRGSARPAPNGLEVRPRRGEMHSLRHAESAAGPGLPAVSRGGRDGPRAARRRARDRDHLHRGSAGLYAEPADAHGGARLRRRRPDALPAHRRRRGRGSGPACGWK